MTDLEQLRKQLAALTARVERLERAPIAPNHPPPAPTPWARDAKGGAA
jgi:hypothetical protein